MLGSLRCDSKPTLTSDSWFPTCCGGNILLPRSISLKCPSEFVAPGVETGVPLLASGQGSFGDPNAFTFPISSQGTKPRAEPLQTQAERNEDWGPRAHQGDTHPSWLERGRADWLRCWLLA